MANEDAGTNFALGYITEGWRCRLNTKTKEFDNKFVYKTAATLVGDPLGIVKKSPLVQLFGYGMITIA